MLDTEISLALSALIFLALVFLAWPLLTVKLPSKKWGLVFLILPLGAIISYFVLGTPFHSMMAQAKMPGSQTDLVEKLELRLKQNPGSVTDWMLLGRSHLTLKHYKKAEQAFRQALKQDKDYVEALLGLADSLGMQQNGILIGKPEKWIQKAQSINPNHPLLLQMQLALAKQQGDSAAIDQIQKKITDLRP